LALGTQGVSNAEFGFGGAAGKDDLGSGGEQLFQFVIAELVESVAADGELVSGANADAYLAGDLGGGAAVVACDHVDSQSGLMGPTYSAGHFGAGRIQEGDQPQKAEASLGLLGAGRQPLARGKSAAGDGNHSQAAPTVLFQHAGDVLAVLVS
jgi:hypothetical protein